MSDMKQHPLSAAFPAMPPNELDSLAVDIKKNGQREPGLLFEGMVLDGWHRYQACQRVGVAFVAVPLDGADDPIDVALSRNLHRRHMTATQRAAALTACVAWRDVGRPQSGTSAQLSNDEMAKIADVSPRTISQAKAGHRVGLSEEMREGAVSAKVAEQVSAMPASERDAAVKAIKQGKSMKALPQKPEPVPVDVFKALQAEYEALNDKHKELIGELETVDAIRNGDVAKEMNTLRQLLAQAQRARDDQMRQSAEKGKQIDRLTRELKKLGWKGWEKKAA